MSSPGQGSSEPVRALNFEGFTLGYDRTSRQSVSEGGYDCIRLKTYRFSSKKTGRGIAMVVNDFFPLGLEKNLFSVDFCPAARVLSARQTRTPGPASTGSSRAKDN